VKEERNYMKRIYSAAASVALIVFSVSLGQAASKPKDDSPAAEARTMLEQVDSWSASIADAADRLSMETRIPSDSQSDLEGLDILKDNVNKIGRDLRILVAGQEDLDKWESSAVDEILPLMQEVAANTEKAIETFRSDRNHLWTTAFPVETAKVFEDAAKVKALLDGHLKLATVREQEQRIENALDATR
jgi:hypothetical protein